MLQELIVGLIMLVIIFLIARKVYQGLRYPEQRNPCAHCSASCSLRQNKPSGKYDLKKKCNKKRENKTEHL